ncbi:MAG: glycosyltransferase family 2 protein [Thermoproteota archaeon]
MLKQSLQEKNKKASVKLVELLCRRRPNVKIVAAIPAFNEEKAIARVIIETSRYVHKVVVVDDGSEDLTAEIAERLGATVIRHEQNMGKGAALKDCFEAARQMGADILVTLDGDGQHSAKDIPKLVELVLQDEADIAIGCRLMGKTDMPSYRRFGNKVLNFITRKAGSIPVKDSQSGFRAYSKRAIQKIFFSSNGIGVDSEILLRAKRAGLTACEVPIDCKYAGRETSTYNPISHVFRVVSSIVSYVGGKRPMLFFGVPGVISTIIGTFLLVEAIQTFLVERSLPIGIALVSILSLIVGILLSIAAIILHVMVSKLEELPQMIHR